MSPTQCEPLKIISPSIRKNSHPSAEIPSITTITLEVSCQSSSSTKGLTQECTRWVLVENQIHGNPWRKTAIPWEKLEIIFKHVLLREGGSPICNIWCFQSCSPKLQANVFPTLCNLGRSAMVISSPGVYMSLASYIPQIQVGLPAEFSIKWSKCLLCYLKIESKLTKHTGSVEPGRKIKKVSL